MRVKARTHVRNEGSRRFKSAPLHHTVRQFLYFSENRSKSARVRAVCDYAWNPENVFYGAIRWNQAKVIRARFC
jgi:hypothetical protein